MQIYWLPSTEGEENINWIFDKSILKSRVQKSDTNEIKHDIWTNKADVRAPSPKFYILP